MAITDQEFNDAVSQLDAEYMGVYLVKTFNPTNEQEVQQSKAGVWVHISGEFDVGVSNGEKEILIKGELVRDVKPDFFPVISAYPLEILEPQGGTHIKVSTKVGATLVGRNQFRAVLQISGNGGINMVKRIGFNAALPTE